MSRSKWLALLITVVAFAAGSAVTAHAAAPPAINAPAYDIAAPQEWLDESLSRVSVGDEQRMALAADVLFAFDGADVTNSSTARLDEVLASLRETRPSHITVDGYTDDKGAPDYNAELSQRRAASVRDALKPHIDGDFAVVGHGEADPVAPNQTESGDDNPDGRAKNRRVVITFTR